MFLENNLLYKNYEYKRDDGSIICSGVSVVSDSELLALYDLGVELATKDCRITDLLAEREAATEPVQAVTE